MDTQLAVSRAETLNPMLLVSASDLSASTKVKYTRALQRYLDTGADLSDTRALAAYARGISDTEKRWLSAVVGKWADAVAADVKGLSTPETVGVVTATLHRLDALKSVVSAPKQKGGATHIWLSSQQVKMLASKIGNGIVGARDRVAIGLLVCAGLRRDEATSLAWADIKPQPYGDRVRVVLHVKGKGNKGRTVPISDVLAVDLDRWSEYTGRDGLVLRSLGCNKELGASLSSVALFKLVRKYGAAIGVPDLAPHDLRRTYAQIGYQSGVDIGQLSLLLGHESVATTMRYLGIGLNIESTASDFVPW